MKSIFIYILFSFLSISAFAQSQNFHDYVVKTIYGEEYPLSQLKGKKVLVVNVASKCGLTPQYEQLQALYEKYQHENFIIIGFPSNDFREQEPGTPEEIQEFCRLNYGVTFPLMEKVSVTGEEIAPVYQWLTTKELNGEKDTTVIWNFQKFLIDENGNWIRTINPQTKPDSEEVIRWIENK